MRSDARNEILKTEIAVLDKQIEEINGLEGPERALARAHGVIEQLQRSRPEIVHVFDEIVNAVPEGVYLTDVAQTGKRIELRGVAQSSTRVSAFMRNLDGSKWLKDPSLDVVETRGSRAPTRTRKFKLFAQQIPMVDARKTAQEGGEMNIVDDLRALDTNDPGRWPLPIRMARGRPRVRAVFAGRPLHVRDPGREAAARPRETGRGRSCARTFEDKQRKAANLDAYRTQLAEIERAFGAMLRQLPGKTEVPSLLVDISQTGLGAGLEESCSSRPARSRRTSTRSCRSSSSSPAAITSSAIS